MVHRYMWVGSRNGTYVHVGKTKKGVPRYGYVGERRTHTGSQDRR